MTTRVIHKFPFVDAEPMRLPRGDVRLVDYQGDSSEFPTVWLERSVEGGGEDLYFFRGTGHEFEYHPYEQHVGSAICGRFVWHVYRRPLS